MTNPQGLNIRGFFPEKKKKKTFQLGAVVYPEFYLPYMLV